MKRFFKKNWRILLILFISLFFRLIFSFLNPHSDLRTQSEWGRWMYTNNSLKGLYEWNVWGCVWPNHPPLISYVYFLSYKIHSSIMMFLSSLGNFIALNRLAPTKFIWLFNFTVWFGQTRFKDSEFLLGTMIVVKQIMVIADLLIAWLIYYLCKKNKIDWKKYVFSYLLLPFSWYLSSIWGQSDQLSFLFFIISFILLYSDKYVGLSPMFYVIAGNLKPNCILLLPLYLFIFLKNKKSFKKLFIGGLVALVFSLWTVSWFTDQNLLTFTFLELPKKLTTSEGLVTLNAFNFWYIFYPFPSTIAFEESKYLFLSLKNWGLIFYLLVMILSFMSVKKNKIETAFASIFIIGFGSWLFMTGMHERYSFLAIMALLFYSITQKKFFKYFVALSTIYFLSMFYVFSVPQYLDVIKDYFNFYHQLIPRLLSFVNITVYGLVTYSMIKKETSLNIFNFKKISDKKNINKN